MLGFLSGDPPPARRRGRGASQRGVRRSDARGPRETRSAAARQAPRQGSRGNSRMGPAVGRAGGPEGGSGAAETATGRGAAAVTCGRDDGSQSARRTPPRAGSALCQEARRAARGRCWGMARIGGQWRRRCAVGGRRDRRAAGRATSDGHGRGKATARAQRNGGGKRADILRDAERHGTSWHSPPGRRARGHRATERRTAPRVSAPELRYTHSRAHEGGTQDWCPVTLQPVAQ